MGNLVAQLEEKIEKLAQIGAANADNCQEYIQTTRDLRTVVDVLETLVDDRKWPLPKYREMLFIM